jgi:hypothetical protein
MSNMLPFFEVAGADNHPNSTDAICALTAAELDEVAGGGAKRYTDVFWAGGDITRLPF